MSNLTIINNNGQLLVDSREVAEMIEKRHDHLIRDIKGYIEILGKSTTPNLGALDFFIPNTYQDGKGEARPCYLITRKGCDMVANKMTGEKGVLFTATYVTRFEEMEHQIKHPIQRFDIPQTYSEALRLAADLVEKNEHLQLANVQKDQIIGELKPKATYYDLVLQNKSLLSVTKIAKDFGLSAKMLNQILHEERIQFKQGDCWILYQAYAEKGYTQSKTQVIDENRSKLHTYWTQKGRLFIYDLLKNKRGILPIIERMQAS